MKIFFAIVISIVVATTILLAQNRAQEKQTTSPSPKTAVSSPTIAKDQKVNIKASFIIITNGITRNFSAKMYHNLSEDVYLESPDPSIVHVKRIGITWDDFFKTLPMKLTKECLTTGTKETFCSGAAGTLKFYLNSLEDKDLLDRQIKQGDNAQIQFTKN